MQSFALPSHFTRPIMCPLIRNYLAMFNSCTCSCPCRISILFLVIFFWLCESKSSNALIRSNLQTKNLGGVDQLHQKLCWEVSKHVHIRSSLGIAHRDLVTWKNSTTIKNSFQICTLPIASCY